MSADSTGAPAAAGRASWRRLSRRTLAVGGVAVVTLAAGTGIAVASIPSGSGIFHACYSKHSGGCASSTPPRASAAAAASTRSPGA